MEVQADGKQNGYFVAPEGARPPVVATVELVGKRRAKDLPVTPDVVDAGSLARAIVQAGAGNDNTTK